MSEEIRSKYRFKTPQFFLVEGTGLSWVRATELGLRKYLHFVGKRVLASVEFIEVEELGQEQQEHVYIITLYTEINLKLFFINMASLWGLIVLGQFKCPVGVPPFIPPQMTIPSIPCWSETTAALQWI